jgi:hypothetical protein
MPVFRSTEVVKNRRVTLLTDVMPLGMSMSRVALTNIVVVPVPAVRNGNLSVRATAILAVRSLVTALTLLSKEGWAMKLLLATGEVFPRRVPDEDLRGSDGLRSPTTRFRWGADWIRAGPVLLWSVIAGGVVMFCCSSLSGRFSLGLRALCAVQ